VTTPELNPVVQQRRLRSELRAARENAGLTQAQVAEEMVWSISKVIRIETGAVRLSIADLRGLLQLYGVEDRDAVAELVEMGKASRRRAWWDEFREFIGDMMIKYIGLESSASVVRQYQDDVMPGLLQTAEYARAILSVFNVDPELIKQKMEVRIKRQSILEPATGTRFHFILEEAVLRRAPGGPEVMRAQLERVREIGRQPNVSISVVPFHAGAHVGLKYGSFTVLEFPGDERDDLAALERTGVGLILQDDAEQVSEYVEAFVQLEGLTSSEGFDEVVDRLIRDLG
jgi:transcriptional regulator with XRE-family HTH domain